MKRYILVTAMVCAVSASGCTEKVSTAPDLGFLEVDPRTVEVLIPFEDFVDSVQVFGGYGSSADVGRGYVADDFGGLNARTLVYIDDYPGSSAILPGNLTFFDGRIVLFFDTVRGNLDSSSDVEVFKVEEEWHPPTVTWEMVVDTAGEQRAWSQPGGGVTTLVGGGTYDVTDGEDSLTDSLSIPIDSATVVFLGQSNSEAPVGLLIAGAEPGVFLNLVDVVVRLTTSAANVPDSIFEETVPIVSMSYISDPAAPMVPLGSLRVGGTPSWRSVLTMSIPREVTGTPEICGTVGCQIDLTEVDLNLAELVLTTRQTASAFQPQDTSRLEIRPVLSPELLPKAPLGGVVLPFPKSVAPELFSTEAGTQVFFSVTTMVAGVLGVAAATGTVPVTPIALFSAFEPNMIGFASFEGGGGAGAPVLRLLYTVANPVGLP